MNETRRVLVVPATEKGRGGGHVARSATLVRELRALGVEAFLYAVGYRATAEILGAAGGLDSSMVYVGDPEAVSWTFLVLDRFRTPASEVRRWAALGPLVGIDEGGSSRASFDYLLDLLPPLPSVCSANLLDPGLLPLPARRRHSFIDPSRSTPLRILVTFGAEDPAGLTLGAVRSLCAVRDVTVEALLGPLSAAESAAAGKSAGEAQMVAAGARVLRSVPNLKERLADYGLIVTSYGLTAFEAARARVPVLLVSPTPYHERLSRIRGFVSAGVGRSAAAKVGGILTMKSADGKGDREGRPASGLAFISERTVAAAPREPTNSGNESAAALLSRFNFPGGGRCPLCGERIAAFQGKGGGVLARFTDRTYRRCPACGILHMVRPDRPPIVYAHDYFFDDYKKQYGRTYLEDFPQLERAGALRVGRIAELLHRGRKGRIDIPTEGEAENAGPKPRVLDIGCAYGPFLAAARSAGFGVFGVDPAEDAVRFVRDELGIPASVGSFPGFDPVAATGGELFDVVSLWYVIEHFLDLGAALEAASAALKVGGVLAFSTPSGSGISARARFADFLEKSPADHWTIWEPGKTARFLERFGFSLEKIIFTGHHPERFPGLARSRSDGLPRRLAAAASRAFGLGDTFEAYAVKK